MADLRLNRWIKIRQVRIGAIVLGAVIILFSVIFTLLADGKPVRKQAPATLDLTGVIDEAFTKDNANSAMLSQQAEVETLKTELTALTKAVTTLTSAHAQQLAALEAKIDAPKEATAAETATPLPENALQLAANPGFWQGEMPAPGSTRMRNTSSGIHMVSFRKKARKKMPSYLNPAHYVPSNTSVRAVILGGADADASVNGQSKNNGVMLFKFLEDGTLPNGQRSRLKGCRVSGSAYGDISSERAIATLYRLSCAHPGQPIIDKVVTGWVFFNGKVGIKGQPLMRDNKIMQWAGISGALSGIAQAAQYAQSVQQFSAVGVASVVPSANIAPFAAYGGASKAADTLSQYYVRRAEQYHPVIQVGSGNVVTIVFKDGFYLEPEEDTRHAAPARTSRAFSRETSREETEETDAMQSFTVPPEVLGRIDKTYAQSTMSSGVRQ